MTDKKLLDYFNGDEMSSNVWLNKYALRDSDGNPTEQTPDDMHRRMAKYFSEVEEKYEYSEKENVKLKLSTYGYSRTPLTEEKIYELFKDFKYVVPGGSVMSGLGSGMPVSLSNCWVISGPEDNLNDIFRVCNEQSQLFKRRGGVGFDISKLRPNGAKVSNTAKTTTGPVSFMELFSNVTTTIGQCIEGSQRVLTPNGMKAIKDVVIGDSVWTENGFVNVVNVLDKGQKEVVETRTKYGSRIVSTSDHVFVTFGENGPIEKPLNELHVGDSVCLIGGVEEGCHLIKDWIESIEPAGVANVYDITLDSGHMFWCEGFYVHNCGRRGALMISMHIEHPDSVEFIEKKQDLTKVTGANVSVQIGNDFMEAVENDEDYILRWPITLKVDDIVRVENEEYDILYESKDKDGNLCYYKKVKAKSIWERLVHCAWNTAEPGIIFKDRHYDYSPDGLYPQFRGTSTNPCLVGSTLIKTDKGDVAIRDIVEGISNGEKYKVFTFNEQTKEIELKDVIDGFKTKENANIIEIESEDGDKLRLTPNHKVYTENRGWIEAGSMMMGDVLVTPEGMTSVYGFAIVENEDVYDLQVADNENFFANGILVHNCGEIFMHEDSCRLIHVNLSSFIENEFTDKARIDDEKLYEVFYETIRLGDDLVDLEANGIRNILAKIEADGDKGNNEWNLYNRLLTNTLNGRRCGVGFFGLSDAVAKLGYKFDSEEGLEAVKHLMKVMFVAELDSECDMAITRGSFPDFDAELEKTSNDWYKMVEKDFPTQYKKMMANGRRNVSFGTAAPTGTVAMLAHASSGIEPVFMPYYTRRVKCVSKSDRVDFIDRDGEKFTEYINVHPALKEWAKQTCEDNVDEWNEKKWEEAYKKSPWFGSTANDIDWRKRVEIQSIVQERVTHSISSTINLVNDTTEAKVSEIYLESWRAGLKGITVYRDGCRSGVIVSTKKEEEKKDVICVDNSAKRRPKTLDAKIVRFSNKGEKWVGIVGLLDGKPYELFTGMLEKLNIPSWVENASIIKNYEEVTDEVTGETKKVSRYDLCYKDSDGFCVCIDGISRIFNPEFWNYGKLISGLLRHNMPISYIIKVISSLKLDESSINTWKNGVVRALRRFEGSATLEEKCPECGGRLVRENGCIHCIDCGYSKCS